MKKVRYSTLARDFGPAQVNFNEMELRHAARENRVVTIHNADDGNRADFDTVGFSRWNALQYRIFAKPLPSDIHEIIGIKY